MAESWWVNASRDELDRLSREKLPEFRKSRFGKPTEDVNIVLDAKSDATHLKTRHEESYVAPPAQPATAQSCSHHLLTTILDGLTAQPGERYKTRKKACTRFPLPFTVVTVAKHALLVQDAQRRYLTSLTGFQACLACGCIRPLPSSQNTSVSPESVVSFSSNSPRSQAAQPAQEGEAKMFTLTRVKLYPNGDATYGIPGVKGRLAIKKGMLNDGVEMPETLNVEFDGFRPASDKAQAKAAAKAERDAKKAEKANKIAERARKAQEKAEKLAAQAAKLGVDVNAPKAEEPASADAPAETADQPNL